MVKKELKHHLFKTKIRNKLTVQKVCFVFKVVFVFKCYLRNPRKEAKIKMHVMVSKEEKFICHGNKPILFLI